MKWNAYLNYSKSLERQKIIVKKVDVLNEKKDFLKFQLDELANYDFQNWDEEAIQNDYKIAANQDEINDILKIISEITGIKKITFVKKNKSKLHLNSENIKLKSV